MYQNWLPRWMMYTWTLGPWTRYLGKDVQKKRHRERQRVIILTMIGCYLYEGSKEWTASCCRKLHQTPISCRWEHWYLNGSLWLWATPRSHRSHCADILNRFIQELFTVWCSHLAIARRYRCPVPVSNVFRSLPFTPPPIQNSFPL